MIRYIVTSTAAVLAGMLLLSQTASAQRPLVDFPTANRALLEGRPERFYMHVNRTFEGRTTTPWEGGAYGFVRGPQRSGGSVVYLRHHEGVDIAPLHRDPAGNPLDPILAAADGRVVYVNDRASGSNYGRYVVIEHIIDGSPYYSLYAHMATISAREGQRVAQGDRIGVMGYTGVGLDRARAHLHFEFCVMISPYFEEWFPRTAASDPNPHGNFNGRNLLGVDPVPLLLAARKNPGAFRLGDHLRSESEAFRLVVPQTRYFDLVRRYPWLVPPGVARSAPAWGISFSENGTPVRATPMDRVVTEPYVDSVTVPAGLTVSRATRNLVAGTPARPVLTNAGRQLATLLTQRPE